jgi:hypothetical protein
VAKLYYDTEFLEDGKTIDFLSIGIAAEDGREYYAVTNDTRTIDNAWNHPWLRKNVMNQLPIKEYGAHSWELNTEHRDYSAIKPKDQIRDEIARFLADTREPELWAWYGAYDHVVLAQFFGKMIDLPVHVPMWTNDLRQELHRLGNPRIPEQKGGNHNALADAKWNREIGRYMEVLSGDFVANPKRSRIW